MNDELNVYRAWNRALWKYFFPHGIEDAILYLDDGIIEQIASDSAFQLPDGMGDWSDFFLRSILLEGSHFEYFLNQIRAIPSISDPHPRPKSWDKLVLHLMRGKIGEVPAYFAMLCSILYMAAKYGAKHEEMRKGARRYLGENFNGKFGELVDPLLQQLHINVPSFNQNRMICGTQRHMSRIKFHLVLPRAQRDDFIDFIEINNLKWDWEETPYAFYIDNILVPTLANAEKHELAQKVTRQENIPYFKSILQSDLDFGRTISRFRNVIQEKDIRWKYQLYFDFNGNYHFYIISDYVLPFGVEVKDDSFEMTDDNVASDYIAENVHLKSYDAERYSKGGLNYSFSNVSFGQHDYGNVFFFEAVSEDTYLQVEIPLEGRNYYAFVSNNFGRIPSGWTLIEPSAVDGFSLYEIPSFSGRQRAFNASRQKLVDSFCRQRMGSWYSIKLDEGQDVYWIPNEVGGRQVHISEVFTNTSGITFFRIPSRNTYLSGTLLVKKGGKEILSEPVYAYFRWSGKQSEYHLNGWGELSSGEFSDAKIKYAPLRKAIIPGDRQSESHTSGILLQLIYESADEMGRITKRKLDAAISFSLSYYGITWTFGYSRSIINGLRRLGYVIGYEGGNQEFYQLSSPYLEKTNYSISQLYNAYLVKGVYGQDMLSQLLTAPGILRTIRIRPYEPDTFKSHPEYICLPDQILFESEDTFTWETLEHPIAQRTLMSMEDIRGFYNKFNIAKGGKVFKGVPPKDLPGMIKTSQGLELLCTKQDGQYVIHPYYEKGDKMALIPKHLSRLYAQVQRSAPICIMSLNPISKDLDYAHVSFVNNMGVPDLLDIALCDLNLIMPSYEKVFIVYQDSLGTSSSNPWTERRTYGTHAMTNEHSFMMTWLSKLAGGTINDIKQEPNKVFITRIRRDYKLFLCKKFKNHKDLLTLYDGERLSAFSLGQDVYFYETQSDRYKRVIGDDVNIILSDIITNKRGELSLAEPYNKTRIDDIRDVSGIQIPILERILF